jgi:hypothetical protein
LPLQMSRIRRAYTSASSPLCPSGLSRFTCNRENDKDLVMDPVEGVPQRVVSVHLQQREG